MSLARVFGMRRKAIYEVIVTSMDLDGQPHAAPMGVKAINEESFSMKSYGKTKTLENLKFSRRGILNLVNDVEVFFHCLFKPHKLSFTWSSNTPRLKAAPAWLLFQVNAVEAENEHHVLLCSALEAHARKAPAKPLCRAEHSLLESLVHYTRIKHYEERGDENEVQRLKALVNHHLNIVERTGWPRLRRMAREIKQALE